MNYESLVHRVKDNDILQSAIQGMIEDDPDVLNLVRPDWNDVLLNDPMFQDYANERIPFEAILKNTFIHTQRIKNGKEMKVLVVGYFSFISLTRPATAKSPARPISFFAVQICPPIDEFGKVLMKGTQATEYCQNAKLYVPTCRFSLCRYCPDYFKHHKFTPEQFKDWWCIPKTKIFNGDELRLVSRLTVEKDFTTGHFIGIFSLTLNQRQFYGNEFKQMKLNGQINDMILFKESSLGPRKNISYKFLPDFRAPREMPAAAAAEDPEFVPSLPLIDSESVKDGVIQTEADDPNPKLEEPSLQTDCIPETFSNKREIDNNDSLQVQEVKRFKLT